MTTYSTLTQIVERAGPLDFRRSSRYVMQLAADLIEFYRSHPFHGSVSPANTYLDQGGRLHLGSPDAQLSHYYIAPEEILSHQECDERTDIYNLGATFYFCVAGEPPFTEGSVSEILLQHHLAEPPRLQDRRPEIPDELAALCSHMLAKDRAMRCPSAQHVIAVLREWLDE
jgi:eukaryotic-like serine/threonine-protein kinase